MHLDILIFYLVFSFAPSFHYVSIGARTACQLAEAAGPDRFAIFKMYAMGKLRSCFSYGLLLVVERLFLGVSCFGDLDSLSRPAMYNAT